MQNIFNKKEKEHNIDSLNRELKKLKAKERDIDSLGDFSKRLYFSSIPVVFLFTIFIELLSSTSFNFYDYMALNGITLPSVVLMNTFICGTSKSRKRKLAVIGNEIKNTESEINTLFKENIINQEKNNQNIQKLQYQIKPIDRTFEIGKERPLTKILNKK